MKTLLILRHARAGHDAPSGSDFDRALTGRGQHEAASVGREFRAGDRRVDAIVASPAVRVVETVVALVEGAGLAATPVWDRRLYNASFATLVEVIRAINETAGAALIVGHNPGLHELIVRLAEDDRGGFPPAALAELSLSVDHWSDVAPGCGHIQSLVRPGDVADG